MFATSLTAYLTDAVIHTGELLNWFDLNVYNDAGLVTRQLPIYLYKWQLGPTVKFTYTPFAGIVFAAFSYLSWSVLRWVMTIASLLSLPITAWLTLGAMGRRGLGRAAMALAIGAFALWTEPVTKALFLGQIEPLLLLLVVWDLTSNDEWRWKGIGVGVAAGIKLIPLLFIPYLLAAGKIRQTAAAVAAFAATVAIGFIVLPEPSISYWLSGYFVRPGRTGGVDALVNQSLLGMIARQTGGGVAAQPIWLPIAAGVALLGIAGAALLVRAGKQVHGWVLVGITSLLVSPISWDHHWVWIIPLIALLAGELDGQPDLATMAVPCRGGRRDHDLRGLAVGLQRARCLRAAAGSGRVVRAAAAVVQRAAAAGVATAHLEPVRSRWPGHLRDLAGRGRGLVATG